MRRGAPHADADALFGALQLGRPKLHELTSVLVEEDETHGWVEAIDDRKGAELDLGGLLSCTVGIDAEWE